MDITHILVPVDFSTCSLLVTRRAASLAQRLQARLTLLHVLEFPDGLGPDTVVRPEGVPVRAEDWVTADATVRLEPFRSAAAEVGVEAELRLATGPIADTILTESAAAGADLIMIGTHGRHGLARLVLGSVAEGVARAAHVPVMLIRREARPECDREDCNWCGVSGLAPAEERLRDERDG